MRQLRCPNGNNRGTAHSLHAARKQAEIGINISTCLRVHRFNSMAPYEQFRATFLRISSPPSPKTRIQAVANKSQKAVPRFAPMRHGTVFQLPGDRDTPVSRYTIMDLSMNFSKE